MPILSSVLNPTVFAALEPLLAQPGHGRCVCFDADGTLWRGDVGEDLLRYLASEDRLPAHQGQRDLYSRYEAIHHRDPAGAYAFAVQAMAGLEQTTLQLWCAEFFARRFAGRLFPFTRPLLEAFLAAGYTPWLVSASPRWIVEAGARALGLANVIGVDCELDDGRLTARIKAPVPAGEGKVGQLKLRGLAPVFAAGNGDLDLPMLELAATRLVIAPWDDPGNLLVRVGLERGWPVQRG